MFKHILLMTALAASYIGLFFFFMPITLPMENPSWWYELLGENAFSAISWAQIAHSLGMLLAALPVALVIVRVYPLAKFRVAMLVASALALFISYDLLRGMMEFGVPDSGAIQISHLIDVTKTIPIMLCVVYVFAVVLNTNAVNKRG